MSAKFYTLLTEIGAAKLASAAALGVPLKITHMAVGDGGGVLPTPSAQQTALVAEKRRAALNMLYIDPQNSSQIIAEQVIPETEGGWWIREVGLFDETGALIAVGNSPESYKPQLTEGSGRTQTVRMVLITSSTDNITLKIDPAVVLATRKYVDDKALELKVYVDDLMAKHLAAPDPHSQYAPKESPTFTGTPKAPTPAALDTLNELAAALGNDPNFATTVMNALAGKQPLDTTLTNLSGKDNAGILQYLGLKDALLKGDGRFLAGTFVSDAIDRTSIGARAATGCQFMRAHQAPDAPDQVSFWQIITLSEVVSPTTVVDVLAVSGNNVLFGHGTGAGITSWRQVAMLEGGAFTGGISAPNMRGDTLVTVGDGTGGMAKGDVDGAGFNGNNLNIKSWNGIGFQNSEDLAIRAYISTRLGVIAAAENLQAGNAIFNKNGDVYGDIWGTGSGPGWLSAYIAGRPLRQYITMVGVYQNDKTKPFMLHDDGSGVFLATTDMLSGYVQSIRFGAVEHGNVYRSPGFADQLGYVITGVENGDSNETPDRIQRRLLQLKVNGQWYTVGA
ncbi:phage tail protein [Salmonella enterica]|uniref:Phage tail protein n=8 Tax=Salmonella enterica TaxID=28901 RepID=A0A3Z0Y0R9_SALET|nr:MULTISPECIES: phage tail protein [Salmonella]EAW2028253.1 phage tail protein [Salmonella enterica subsp. enterica]ECA3048811.1 phage tail protein [Salmonella enterica subsp. enterica serovar Rostock]ECG8142660.1 phage tail protein [Salmonella enterica subsp. enterica serovar Choleraesuis]ECM7120569.1 phage tail protein [Salmonella enterica subsp. enterica serovar Typhimurium]EDP9758784.1 phage tail protein [Salmonella enterica subsp. enterica serovar Oranienburg]EDT4977732.1 phage tail pro